MVDVLKTFSDISFNEPDSPSEGRTYLFKRSMTASIRPKAMREVAKDRLIDSFKNEPNSLLNEFIPEGRISNGRILPLRLGIYTRLGGLGVYVKFLSSSMIELTYSDPKPSAVSSSIPLVAAPLFLYSFL